MTEGTASFDLRTVDPGRTVEVDTPNAVFTIEHAGYYRVGVSGGRTSFITRRGGNATVISARGEAVSMAPSEEMVIEGTESPQVSSYAAPQLDAWDRWNYDRTGYLLDAVSARHVSPGTYGVGDLDRYGTWRDVPSYGSVWVPSGVPSGWAPYSTGTWMHDPYYGWTWVDTAPWGWAPYHYGRWVHLNGFWGWAPGPLVARPVYAPALVAFYGRPGAGVSIGVGSLVGWVALGWGEPCVPWWGPERFRHRPSWHGWGGPRVVNNVVIHNTTVVSVQEINGYRNAGVRNAVVAVNENHFGRGPIQSARVTRIDEKSIRPIQNAPQVRAAPASFAASERRGIQPPERVLGRPVVATRPPHARAESTPGVEGAARPRVPTPAPRIVPTPQQRETASTVQRPPFGQSRVERPTADRARPPAPPRTGTRRPPERAFEGAPSVTRQAPSPQQHEPQVTRPSPAKPQPSERQTEGNRAQPAASPKIEAPRPAAQASKAAPSVTRQAPSPQQPEPQVIRPSPAEPQPSERQTVAVRPPARVLPGEPANRLSPNRAEGKPQQRKEQPMAPGTRPRNPF